MRNMISFKQIDQNISVRLYYSKVILSKYIILITKCVLTDIASVVKTVEHFIDSQRP